jgi:hypothetical protein
MLPWASPESVGRAAGRENSNPAERRIAVRDSKDPHGPKLAFSPAAWQTFTSGAKQGRFDL